MTPYQLVYGKTCHLPVELEFKSHLAIKRWNMDLQSAGIKRQIQLAELDEWREKAYHSSKLYKQRTKRWHDKRIKMDMLRKDVCSKIKCLAKATRNEELYRVLDPRI